MPPAITKQWYCYATLNYLPICVSPSNLVYLRLYLHYCYDSIAYRKSILRSQDVYMRWCDATSLQVYKQYKSLWGCGKIAISLHHIAVSVRQTNPLYMH